MASLPETEMETEPDSGNAAEISQQLHALASLLGISGEFQQAEKLLDSINQGVAAKMKALPQAFLEPVLPEDSLSDAQAGRCRS
jgi:ATP phosphoribosyltransferase regulatory subunit HisZ